MEEVSGRFGILGPNFGLLKQAQKEPALSRGSIRGCCGQRQVDGITDLAFEEVAAL
jgi:hypothetical protein